MKERTTSHILMVYAGKTTTADIMGRLMNELAGDRAIELKAVEGINVNKSDIAWADCVVVIRGADLFLSSIMKASKQAGKFCIFYLDDDLLSLYELNDSYYRYLMNCLTNTDLLWASSTNVIDKYRHYLDVKARTVIAVVLDPWKHFEEYKKPKDGIGIIFAGSPAHEKAIGQYIIPALKAVHDKHEDIRAYFIGFKNTSVDGIEPYITATEWFENAEAYRKFVAEINVQIGIAVIEDSDFGRCKFYNKYLEYAKLGVVGIYSNCEPYTFVVKDKINGLLTENTVDAWADKIQYAIDHSDIREQCVIHSQEDLKNNYSVEGAIASILSEIPELINYRASETVVRYNSRKVLLTGRLNRLLRYVRHPRLVIDRLTRRRK